MAAQGDTCLVCRWQGRHDPLNNAVLRAERLKALCPHVRVELVEAGRGEERGAMVMVALMADHRGS